MSGYAIPSLVLIAGICFYAGASHLYLALRRRTVVHALFGTLCLMAFGYALASTNLYRVVTTDAYISVVRQQLALGTVWNAIFVWFVAFYSGCRPVRFLLVHNAGCVLILIATGYLPDAALFAQVQELESRTLSSGESLQSLEAIPGPLVLLGYLLALLSLGFAYVCCVSLVRSRLYGSAIVLGIATSLQLVAFLMTGLIDLNVLELIALEAFAFLAFVLLMTFRLANELELSDRALRSSERLFRQMAETIQDGFYLVELATGKLLYLSPAFESLTGRLRNELIARPQSWYDLMLPSHRQSVEASFAQLSQGVPFEAEYQFQLPDGSERWVVNEAFPIKDQEHEGEGFLRAAGVIRDITREKQAEITLRHAETLHRLTLENITDAVFITDDADQFKFVCPNADVIFGYNAAEVRQIGSFSQLVGADLFDSNKLQEDGEIRHLECRIQDKAGGNHDLLINVRKVSINGGTRLFVCRDITERKQAEQALRASEAQTRAILASLSAHIAVIDASGTIVAVNPAWEEFARQNRGLATRCNLGTNYLEVCRAAHGHHSEGACEVAAGLEAVLAGKSDFLTVEYPCPSPTEMRWFLLHASPLRSNHGGAVVSHTNITKRKQAEEDLQRAHEFSESLINTARNIVLVLEPGGRIVRFNPYTEALTGWRLAEVQDRDWFDTFLPERERPRIRQLFRSATAGQRMHGNIHSIVTRDGQERQIEWYDAPLTNADGQLIGLLYTGQDVTERQMLQREILEIAAEEQRRIGQELHDSTQQQLTGLGLLAQYVATSLGKLRQTDDQTQIEWPSRLWDRIEGLTQKATRVYEVLVQTAREVNQLARGLIPVEVDAQGLMAALEELTRSVNEVQQVKCTFDSKGPVEIRDNFTATHLYRIAQEAVNNAIKHSGGDEIIITLCEVQGLISLRILDNGKGIDEQRDGPGTGLRIMAYRAELIGAMLSIAPAMGCGTEIVCTLPQRAEAYP